MFDVLAPEWRQVSQYDGYYMGLAKGSKWKGCSSLVKLINWSMFIISYRGR